MQSVYRAYFRNDEGLIMKKVVKIIGNIIMLSALVFIVKKFIDMDIDFSELKSPPVISALIISFVVQTVIVVMGCFPWLMFTRSLSGKKIPFSKAMPVYTKSNIYKYLPGNVFQYVGRNQLAFDMNISHIDVACATVFDILFCVVSTGIISTVLLGSKIEELIEKYGRNFLIIGMSGIIAVIIVIFILYFKFREKFHQYILRYSKAFRGNNLFEVLKGILYYFLQNGISAVMYFFSMKLIFNGTSDDFSLLVTLTGAFMFAWIIGFITPGAPGGIGIRESVMIFVFGGVHEEIMLFVLVMRISSILADIMAFITGRIYLKMKKADI